MEALRDTLSAPLLGLLFGLFASYTLPLIPFGLAMGLYLGLNGVRFGALSRTMLVALAVSAVIALLVQATPLWVRAIPVSPGAIAPGAAVLQRLLWSPEILLAVALCVYGFMNGVRTKPPLSPWISGAAMAGSHEAAMWCRLVLEDLEPRTNVRVHEVIFLLVVGFSGAMVLALPGWLIGRMIHDARTPARSTTHGTIRGVWAVWPAWIMLSVAARWLHIAGLAPWP